MLDLKDLLRWIRRDPAGRGMLSDADSPGSAYPDDLRFAAESLNVANAAIGIVTGFYVPHASPPAAETDGPLGSLLLADILQSLGVQTTLITDELCAPALNAAARSAAIDLKLLVCPVLSVESRQWRNAFWKSDVGQQLTHLISIERIGPSLPGGPLQGRCLNIRGEPIDDWSADLFRLFEDRPPHVRTIGIGDGGNEIGMGRYWAHLPQTRSIAPNACRTATDWLIIAGVSDWGAMALAVATLLQHGDWQRLNEWTSARMEHVLSRMVVEGPAIDGCTRLQQPTVDGLPFSTYIQPWELIRRELGFST